jgi:hypothetical protein
MVRALLALILVLTPAHASYVIAPGGVETTVTVLDYTDGSDFTYTASAIEPDGGGAKLKFQYADDVLFAATYTSSLNAVYSKFGGTLTATTSGTVTATGGLGDLSGGDGVFKKLQYDAHLNNTNVQVGSVRFKATPDYTGTPGTRQWYYASSMALSSNVNMVFFEHHTDGVVYYYVYNSSGSTVATNDFAWAPTADQTYEILMTWDLTTGLTEVFVDGVQKDTSTATGTRDSRVTYLKFGASDGDTTTDHADFRIDDLVVYSAVQQTADYTPGYTVSETKYVTTDPFIEQSNAVTVSEWVGVTGVESLSGSDTIKCQLRDDGTLKYWNGSSWATSDGTYSQASTLTDINNQIATAPTGSIKMRCGLHSADGSTTPTLSSIVMEYQ